MKIAGGTSKKTGERYASYYCVGRYAKGACRARATIRASYLDSDVEQQVLTALTHEDGLLAHAVEATDELTEAQRAHSKPQNTSSRCTCKQTSSARSAKPPSPRAQKAANTTSTKHEHD